MRHLYKYNNIQAQGIVNNVINKIENCNISYFRNQKNVINMFDILQELGLAMKREEYYYLFQKLFMMRNCVARKSILMYHSGNMRIMTDIINCDGKTVKFIENINDYKIAVRKSSILKD